MGSAHIGRIFLGVWRINGFYELIFLHEGAIVENLEVYSNEFTPGCGYITTHQFFVVERDAHWVTVTQSKLGRYPTTARQKQQVSSFCGLISAKNRPYVTFLFWYTIIVDEEIMVLPLGILVLTP